MMILGCLGVMYMEENVAVLVNMEISTTKNLLINEHGDINQQSVAMIRKNTTNTLW